MIMKKQKDLVYDINLKTEEKITKFASELGLVMYQLEGSLMDDWLIENDGSMQIGRGKPRKYIIIKEYYLSEWSSGLKLILTDDDDKANELYTEWSKRYNDDDYEF